MDPEAEKLYPKAYPATLVATLKDGRTMEAHVDYPKGDPENPASLEEIVDKFNVLTEPFFEADRRKQIVDEILKLDKLDQISRLGDLVR